jgi:hypothetical protein
MFGQEYVRSPHRRHCPKGGQTYAFRPWKRDRQIEPIKIVAKVAPLSDAYNFVRTAIAKMSGAGVGCRVVVKYYFRQNRE